MFDIREVGRYFAFLEVSMLNLKMVEDYQGNLRALVYILNNLGLWTVGNLAMTRLGDILNLGHALELTIVIFLFVDSEEDMGWGRKQNLELLSDVEQYP